MLKKSKPHNPLKIFVNQFFEEKGITSKTVKFDSVPADGSTRIFWRVSSHESEVPYILVENPPTDRFSRRENDAYLNIGRHLHEKGVPVPEIFRVDMDKGIFIMEDKGNRSLQDASFRPHDRLSVYKKVLKILFKMQTAGAEGFDISWPCQTKTYDADLMRRYESDYFKDAFLCNFLGLREDLSGLERPFDHIAEMASRSENLFFLHRDFQSRNIILSDDKIGVIDWQGGRLGPLGYDVASLLIDPYVSLAKKEKENLFLFYLDLLRDYKKDLVESFIEAYPYLAIQRNLQILGAFSFLSKVKKKPFFEDYIPSALQFLHDLLNDLKDPKLVPLEELVDSLI